MIKCTLCDLCIRGNLMTPVGHQTSSVMLLFNHPDYYENKHNEALNSTSKDTVLLQFKDIGLNIHNMYITYINKCYSKDDVTDHQRDICFNEYLIKELNIIKPKIIIVIDNKTLINLGKVLKVQFKPYLTVQYTKKYAVFCMATIGKQSPEPDKSGLVAKFKVLLKFYKSYINPYHIV